MNKLKKRYMEIYKDVIVDIPTDDICFNSFAPFKLPCSPCVEIQDNPVPCTKAKEGNKPMYVENDKHIESAKINYLQERISSIYYDKTNELRRQFGLVDDDTPETVNDLVKRIQDGKFIVKSDTADKHVYEPGRYIRWRDPSVKEDKEGFATATKAFVKAKQDTCDTVAIGTPAEGLAAVKALEAWTPTMGNA